MAAGGAPSYAFQALTGEASTKYRFQVGSQRWQRFDVAQAPASPAAGLRCNVWLHASDEVIDGSSMFRVRALSSCLALRFKTARHAGSSSPAP